MAEPQPPIQFEDIPIDEARRMGRGLRMEPMLYETLRQKLETLSGEAVRIHLGPEITPTRMKNSHSIGFSGNILSPSRLS